MVGISRAVIFCMILAFALVWVPPGRAQRASDPVPAPIPAQIMTAKKVFISNLGEESEYSSQKRGYVSGGRNRFYNMFYASMKSWGRYEIVASPADADLVFELLFRGVMGIRSQFRLTILDSKTHFALWAFTVYAEPASREATWRKNVDRALMEIVDDVKKLAAQPVTAADSAKILLEGRAAEEDAREVFREWLWL
jgi:hypothetical protein